MRKYFLILIILLSCSCGPERHEAIFIEGRAQGTMYRITCYGNDSLSLHAGIDSIFNVIDNSLSLYNENSLINKINRNESNSGDYHLINVLRQAIEFAEKTGGRFDFTVGGIVDEWNKAKKAKTIPDSTMIDSLLNFTGYKLISISGDTVIKKDTRVRIDLNAIAQGYTVDVIADYLVNHGIKDYIIELGGEVKAGGHKAGGTNWAVGIEKPPDYSTAKGDAIEIFEISNKAMATSGSFRQYYTIGKNKYPHIIDPVTGRPVSHNLLSVTVISGKCSEADALATAFMVMGLEKSLEFLKNNEKTGAFFIYTDAKGKMQTLKYARDVRTTEQQN